MNYLRFGMNLLRGKLTGQKVPLQLNMHITDVCNLRCTYCYIDFDHALKDMPLETMRRILAEARECGVERVSLEGGEPLARKDIGDLVDVVTGLGLECNINTNAYFIPRHIERLKKVACFSISIDGPREVHDRLRGAGSFDKALEGARVAREHGIKLHFLSVLTKQNRGHIPFMLDLADEFGAQWVPNSLFFMAGHQIDRDEAARFKIDDEDYRRLLGEIADLKAGGRPVAWSQRTLRYVRDWPKTYFESNMFETEDVAKSFDAVACQASKHFLVMQTNGDLYSCDPLLGYGKPANAGELGFRQAMLRTGTHGCIACNSIVCTEYHNLFSLSVPVILNLLEIYALRRRSASSSPAARRDGLPREPSRQTPV